MSNYKDIDYALAKVLLDRVQTGAGILTYGKCADILTQELGRKVHAHGGLRMPLYRVANLCFETGVPFLSTLVVLKNEYYGEPTGQGFYKMACEYRPEYRNMKPADVWKAELTKIQQQRDWSSLSAHLERHFPANSNQS